MHCIKQREKPILLTALGILDRRLSLPYREKQYLTTLSKGYEGELLFDSLLNHHLTSEALVLNDLSLLIGNSSIQIDSLIFTSEACYLYEVKNFEGNHTNLAGQFRTDTGQEFVSPAGQLNRTTTLLRNLVSQWDHKQSILSTVVFVNPSFLLYEAKQSDPFLFLPQIESHFNRINRRSSKLSVKTRHIADRLLEEGQKELPYHRKLPLYDFQDLKKGLSCSCCGSFNLKNSTKVSCCENCGQIISLNTLFLSEVQAVRCLFPDKPLTSNLMYDWCGGTLSKRRISAILRAEFSLNGFAKSSHYT